MAQEGTSLKRRHQNLPEDCQPISELLGHVGDKWTIMVIRALGDGPTRHNELQRSIGGISQKMLTATLRTLERDGFVTRTIFATVPPRVDYALTGLGRELLVPVTALAKWAQANQTRIDAARATFDGKGKEAAGPPREQLAEARAAE
jgi:DNA-binding HxlR family transcriptional regulator